MNEIKDILTDSIAQLIQNSSTPGRIKKLEKKHNVKLHFIPYRYRIFGGILQSMNIQFGNFIEKVMDEVIRNNPNNEIIEKYSGKKSNKFHLSKKSDALIDAYISKCQTTNMTDVELQQAYEGLLKEVKNNELSETSNIEEFKHDVDVLFRDKSTDTYYYMEIKYNDDHDSGKFVDINRKLLKTYAYLQRELGDVTLKPILFYFTNKKMKGNIYLPEQTSIYRGKRFFNDFTKIKYEDMDNYMKNISESDETKKIFDDLYNKVVHGNKD